MFLIRSAFWLTLAFLVIRPGVDMRDTATTMSSEAMTRGSQFIAQQIEAIDCTDLTCIGGKALANAALQSTVPALDPMHASSAVDTVPLPRPRPAVAG